MDEHDDIYNNSSEPSDLYDSDYVNSNDEIIEIISVNHESVAEYQSITLDNDEQLLQQLAIQTQYEFITLCLLFFVVGLYLFSWGVKLWKSFSH